MVSSGQSSNLQTPKAVSKRLNWREWSLRLQLTTVVLVIGLAVVISITSASILRQNESLRSQMEARAITSLISIDVATIDNLYFANVDQIETIAENFTETSGILAVRIYDANGRLLVATDDTTLGTSLNVDPFGVQLLQTDNPQIEWTNDRLVAGKPVTVGNQVLGAVHVELSISDLNEQLQISLLQGFVAAILVSIFGVIAVLIVSRSLTAPIATLVNQTKSIAEGDLTKPIHVQGGSFEITELVYTIEDMRKNLEGIYAELEHRIDERTAELKEARDEALASQRIANENSRLKSEFLSMMSHELRTPMNAILGFTGIILNRMANTDYNEKTGRYLIKVKSNGERLLNLINDFLDLSRIEAGRLELAYLPISPTEMAQNWQNNLGVLADNKNIKFKVNIDSNLPETIYGDEESLSKIAINLVGNAVKFTEEGTISLSLKKQDEWMVLEVNDTGVGIPPHARDFIFDEFRQVDQTSTRKHGGTGLGLAIVQKLAREMNGTVSLQSEVGVGSTFTVLVPIHTEEQVIEGVV